MNYDEDQPRDSSQASLPILHHYSSAIVAEWHRRPWNSAGIGANASANTNTSSNILSSFFTPTTSFPCLNPSTISQPHRVSSHPSSSPFLSFIFIPNLLPYSPPPLYFRLPLFPSSPFPFPFSSCPNPPHPNLPPLSSHLVSPTPSFSSSPHLPNENSSQPRPRRRCCT